MSKSKKKNPGPAFTFTNREKQTVAVNYGPGVAIAVIAAIVILVAIIAGTVSSMMKRNYYLYNLKVVSAVVSEKSIDEENGNKNYIRIFPESSGQLDTSDGISDLWIEVKPDFYSRHNQGERVGVLIGEYDVFKKGKIEAFEKSTLQVEEIYDTYEDAMKTNPYKKFSMPVSIKQKTMDTNGNTYFIIDADDNTLKIKVDRETYDKHEENQQLDGEFESTGDFERFLKLNDK